ncbi:hypothetical protein [Gordonia sp. FQ]|uniref:hypothetical protein n=1 Tax=Gordonia sp. FQ TaxID=3446634 RepID=UPI003F82FD65
MNRPHDRRRLAPGARDLSRAEAADQRNAADALDQTGPNFLWSLGQTQETARAAPSMPVGARSRMAPCQDSPRA